MSIVGQTRVRTACAVYICIRRVQTHVVLRVCRNSGTHVKSGGRVDELKLGVHIEHVGICDKARHGNVDERGRADNDDLGEEDEMFLDGRQRELARVAQQDVQVWVCALVLLRFDLLSCSSSSANKRVEWIMKLIANHRFDIKKTRMDSYFSVSSLAKDQNSLLDTYNSQFWVCQMNKM